jgi:deoxycytidylate deaminase
VAVDVHVLPLRIGDVMPPRSLLGDVLRDLDGVDEGPCDCIHAEANAVAKLRFAGPIVAYCTHAPCPTCAALLVNAGVVELHWRTWSEKGNRGLALLKRAGVSSHHWPEWPA